METAALAQIKVGKATGARNTLKDASLTVENIVSEAQSPDTENLTSYSHIAAMQEQSGDSAGALKTLRQLHNAADKVADPADKSIALSDIIMGLFAPQ